MRVQDSHEDYLAREGYVSNSLIKLALESDFNYQWFKNAHRPPTDEQILGTAIHTAILEHDKLYERVTHFTNDMLPEADKNGKRTMQLKSNKDWYANFLAENSGKIVLDEDDWRTLTTIGEIAQQQRLDIPEVGLVTIDELISTGSCEKSVYIDDERKFGLKAKIRPDFENSVLLLDVKSTKSGKPSSFHRDVYKFGYHTQIPFYKDVLFAEDGHKREGYILTFETKPPYHISLFKLSEKVEEYGRLQYMYGINKIKRIQREGATIGYEADKYEKAGSAIVLPQLKFMQDVDYND